MVLAAVTQHGRALEFSSEECKDDKTMVLAAVAQDGWASLYASEELRNNKEVVLTAVAQDGEAFYFASEDLQNNAEVVQAAIMQLLIQTYNTKSYDGKETEEEVVSLIRKLVSKQVLVPLNHVIHVVSACELQWNHGMSNLIDRHR